MKYLLPDWHVEHVTELTPTRLLAAGVRGLLLDVDGTLKPHYATQLDDDTLAWLLDCRDAGMQIAFLSNGKGTRIRPLADGLNLPVFTSSCKPLPFACRRAVAQLGLPSSEVLMVGDQLFTDVLAGRLAGTRTAYVQPLSPSEPIYTSCKRPLERLVFKLCGRQREE
jgi:HAD superfamily phosphatase (TIGR01668 family)